METVSSGRVERRFTQKIAASPREVFPLLCPMREREWLDGWSGEFEWIHSESGLAEEGCVFRTRVEGRPETIWSITRHDPEARVVEFFRVTPGLVATRLRIVVEPLAGAEAAADGSAVAIAYTFTPLCPEGVAFVADHFGEAAFVADMRWWEESMNHWLRSGEMLRVGAGTK